MQVGRLGVGSAVAGGVLGIAAMVGVGVAATGVSAQTPGATPTATATAKADRAQIGADYLAKLAANLGVTADQLKAANVATQNQLIDEAVAAGRLTAAQATEAKARVAENGGAHLGPNFRGAKGPGGPGGHGGPGGAGARLGGDIMEPVTTLLGIDAATLRSELASGKSLAQIAEARGKTREQLKQVLAAQFGTMIDKIIDQVPPVRPAAPAAPSATPQS